MEEAYVAQLKTPTTCYSAGLLVRGGSPTTTTTRFASESHAFQFDAVGVDKDANATIRSRTVPSVQHDTRRRRRRVICVGYDAAYATAMDEVGDDTQASAHVWELFGLLLQKNREKEQSQIDPAVTGQQHPTVSSDTTNSALDAPSQSTLHHVDSDSMAPPEAGDKTTMTKRGAPALVSGDTAIQAWLVLSSHLSPPPQQQQHLDEGSSSHSDDECRVPIAFRPLSPHICVLPRTPSTGTPTNKTNVVLVFVGSADDSLLRCYATTDGTSRLEAMELQNTEFQFDSPIMALETLCITTRTSRSEKQENPDNHAFEIVVHLAVGCQDGTIRLLSMGVNDMKFANIQAHTVTVDGPIMTLSFYHDERMGTMRVAVGSMCGFVCQLTTTTRRCSDRKDWTGPWMVREGLWDARLDTEDPVLAVHCDNRRIAAGTQSGQCFVWEQGKLTATPGDQETLVEDKFHLQWHCQLLYPIHGVLLQASDRSLLLSTRRTIHLFRETSRGLYSAATAKERLLRLLKERAIS